MYSLNQNNSIQFFLAKLNEYKISTMIYATLETKYFDCKSIVDVMISFSISIERLIKES